MAIYNEKQYNMTRDITVIFDMGLLTRINYVFEDLM